MPAVVQIGSRTRRSDPAMKRKVFTPAPSALERKPRAVRPAAAVAANLRRVIPQAIPFPPLFLPSPLESGGPGHRGDVPATLGPRFRGEDERRGCRRSHRENRTLALRPLQVFSTFHMKRAGAMMTPLML